MEHKRLGQSGLRVSRICLGMMSYGDPSWREWILDEDAAEPIVRHAVEAGITFYDTADMYSLGRSEEVTGRLLAKFFPNRDDYVLATKVYSPMSDGPNDRGLSRKHIMASIDGSLRRLGTDYIDLYQIHRWDYGTPIEETLATFQDLISMGKVRYIGASSMFAWQFAKAQHTAERNGWMQFVSMQNHYNLLYREEEREMIPLCTDMGIGIIPWSPLARGWLARSRDRESERQTARARSDTLAPELYDDADYAVVDAVREIARKRGVPPAQVALSWLLRNPSVTAPIIGATKVSHIDDAVAAVHLTLDDDEAKALEEPYHPHPVRGIITPGTREMSQRP